jgi:uncharacterized protein YjdB
MRQIGRLMWAAVAVGAIACGGETSEPTRTDATLTTGSGGTDTTGTPPPSAGPVASVTITPKNATLRVGYYAYFTATPRDDKGVYVSGKKATWRSSDASVLVASDTGIFYAKAIGTAKVYGTVDGHVDSASVTVLVAPPDTTINQPPPPAPVNAFNLTLTVAGTVAGADTSRTQPVGGATITVTRVGGVQGDTLNPPVLAGTVTTDANGAASLQNLPGGSYRFVATPPTGSPFVVTTWGIPAPTISNVAVRLVLRRTP